jgi:hypothetical protein
MAGGFGLGKAGDRAIDEGYRRNAAWAGVPVQPKRHWARNVLALKCYAARGGEGEDEDPAKP